MTLSGWTTIDGTYGDGSTFTLRKPTYKFTGVVPEFYSIRIAPPLVGQGLLEALAEADIAAQAEARQADASRGRVSKVVDPETGQLRLGASAGKRARPV